MSFLIKSKHDLSIMVKFPQKSKSPKNNNNNNNNKVTSKTARCVLAVKNHNIHAGKETLSLILANFFQLHEAAKRMAVDKKKAKRLAVLILEKAAIGLFWNNATKIKRKKSL